MRGDVIEEIGTLCSDALHIGVLILHGADHDRIVDRPEFGNAAALRTVDDALRGRRRRR